MKIILVAGFFLSSIVSFGGDYPFSVKKIGTGEQTLLFIPGFASSGSVWNETVEALKDKYSCHVLTMAGFAGVPPQENPTFEKWKTGIVQYIRDENIDKPIIVGHSMGGELALAIAADHPDLTDKIVVVDALPCLMAITNPGFQSKPVNDCSAMVNQITSMEDDHFNQMQKMSIASLAANSSKWDEISRWGISSDRHTFAQMFCDFSNTDLRGRMNKISVPALILLEPSFKNIAAISEQYKNLPQAKIEYAHKGLHFIMFDDTEWYLDQLNAFLK